MQGGGTLGSSSQAYGFLDFIPYVPQTQNTTGITQKVQQEQKAEGILSDDMVKAIMGKGLTSDVNKFMGEIESMYSNPLETNPFGSSLNGSELARKQLALISRINQLQNGKAMFDKAVDAARTSGALDEIAVTSFGKIISINNESGGITQVNPTDLLKNRDKYTPLTNAELANLRMNNTSLAFDTNIFNILENAVGSKEIDDFIRKIINEAGKSTSEYNQFIPGSELRDVKQGLQMLQNGIVEENITNEDNIKQLEAAENYLYKALPDNYRKFLAAKAAASGEDPKEGVFNLIRDYANTKTTVVRKRKLDVPVSLNKSLNSKGTVETNLYEQMAAMQAPSNKSYVDFELNPGTTYSFDVKNSIHYNGLTDYKGESLQPTVTLNTLFTDTPLGVMLDKSGVSVGNQIANPTDFSNIGIDTTQGAVATILPCKDENGKKVVDLDVIARVKDTLGKLNQGASTNEKIDALKGAHLDDYIDAVLNPSAVDNELMYKSGKVAPFLVFSGYASDNNFISDNSAASIISSNSEASKIEEGINLDRKAHNLGEIDFTSGLLDFRAFGTGFGDVNMYRTSVFIPYTPSAVNETLLTNGKIYAGKDDRKLGTALDIKENKNGIMTNFPAV